MATFNGDTHAGRDINIHEHNNQTYKSYDQCTPEELRSEQPVQQRGLFDYKKQRISKTPKWFIVIIIGIIIGTGFSYYVYNGLETDSFTLTIAWQMFITVTNGTHPLVLPLSFAMYLMFLFVIPINRIIDLLLGEDDIIRQYNENLRVIRILLGTRS